jgi:hypothetical protein
MSKKSEVRFRHKIKAMKIHKMSGSKIEMITEILNPKIRGWANYFGRFNPSSMRFTMYCVNQRLIIWAMRKYKRFRGHKKRAMNWLHDLSRRESKMFAHWALGYKP